jgi:hypothetical protein
VTCATNSSKHGRSPPASGHIPILPFTLTVTPLWHEAARRSSALGSMGTGPASSACTTGAISSVLPHPFGHDAEEPADELRTWYRQQFGSGGRG